MGFDDSARATSEHWANAELIARAPSLLLRNQELEEQNKKLLEALRKAEFYVNFAADSIPTSRPESEVLSCEISDLLNHSEVL